MTMRGVMKIELEPSSSQDQTKHTDKSNFRCFFVLIFACVELVDVEQLNIISIFSVYQVHFFIET